MQFRVHHHFLENSVMCQPQMALLYSLGSAASLNCSPELTLLVLKCQRRRRRCFCFWGQSQTKLLCIRSVGQYLMLKGSHCDPKAFHFGGRHWLSNPGSLLPSECAALGIQEKGTEKRKDLVQENSILLSYTMC